MRVHLSSFGSRADVEPVPGIAFDALGACVACGAFNAFDALGAPGAFDTSDAFGAPGPDRPPMSA
ncbi:hypothetical protein [Embleya sp. NPDC050493]|uniref:hypothetical protein n=1 Tax=Embleya sp. NPDC050493 TaxID=3363989 RepID=UPI0037B74328